MQFLKLLALAFLFLTSHLFPSLPTNYTLITPKKRWIDRYIETIGQIQVHKEKSSNQVEQGTIYSRHSSPYIMPLFSYPKITKPTSGDLLSQTETGEYTIVFYQPRHMLETLKEIHSLSPLKVELFISNHDTYPYLSEIHTMGEFERNRQLIKLTAKYKLDPKAFWPNDYIHVRLYTSKEKLFTLPKESIFKDSKGHYLYIAPIADHSLQKKYVKVGQEYGDHYVILHGLASDSIVILPLSD